MLYQQQAGRIRLVITDVVMPGGAVRAGKHLNSLSGEIKVIYMSGYRTTPLFITEYWRKKSRSFKSHSPRIR